jgi:hypothetical protein
MRTFEILKDCDDRLFNTVKGILHKSKSDVSSDPQESTSLESCSDCVQLLGIVPELTNLWCQGIYQDSNVSIFLARISDGLSGPK